MKVLHLWIIFLFLRQGRQHYLTNMYDIQCFVVLIPYFFEKGRQVITYNYYICMISIFLVAECLFVETVLENIISRSSDLIAQIPGYYSYDYTAGLPSTNSIIDGGHDMFDKGNIVRNKYNIISNQLLLIMLIIYPRFYLVLICMCLVNQNWL